MDEVTFDASLVTLADLFPDYPLEELCEQLLQHNCDTQQALEALLAKSCADGDSFNELSGCWHPLEDAVSAKCPRLDRSFIRLFLSLYEGVDITPDQIVAELHNQAHEMKWGGNTNKKRNGKKKLSNKEVFQSDKMAGKAVAPRLTLQEIGCRILEALELSDNTRLCLQNSSKNTAEEWLAKGNRLRQQAEQLHVNIMQKMSAAKSSHSSHLVSQAMNMHDEMQALHGEAASCLFISRNYDAFWRSVAWNTSVTVDFHGLHVKEALFCCYLLLSLLSAHAFNPSSKAVELRCVTGVGNHSGGAGPRLKPALLTYLTQVTTSARGAILVPEPPLLKEWKHFVQFKDANPQHMPWMHMDISPPRVQDESVLVVRFLPR